MDKLTISDVLAQLAAGIIIAYAGSRIVLLVMDWLDARTATRPVPVDPVDTQVWDVIACAQDITRRAAADATD